MCVPACTYIIVCVPVFVTMNVSALMHVNLCMCACVCV